MASIVQRTKSLFSLSGIFPAITTPFNEKQEIYFEKLYENLQHYEKIPFSGYLVCGSNGEVASLTIDERVELVRKVRQWIDPGRILIANAYCESTRQCCELTQSLAHNGADAVLVMIPFYHRKQLSEEAIATHFKMVAESSPVPVVIYNNLGVTGVNLSVDTLVKLAEHPNIIGVKDDGVAKIAELVAEMENKGLNFQVAQGSTGDLLPSLVMGASAGIVALPNILGLEVCQLYQLYREKKLEQAANLQQRLARIDALLKLSGLGVPGMKGALDLMGLYGGPCRLPLHPLPPTDLKRISDQLVRFRFMI